MLAAGLLLAAPFVLSWSYIDERGIEIAGKVFDKREFVTVRHSEWRRSCEVMVWYETPDEPGGSYAVANIDPVLFDRLHKDGTAAVRYLHRRDLPRVPFTGTLRDMHVLPVAKIVGHVGMNPGALRGLAWVSGGVLLLALWRWLRWPAFPWAVAAGVVVFLAAILNSEFPRPVPEPKAAVRRAPGTVASIGRIAYLFGTDRSYGIEARQPIQVVGVRFAPAGATEAVLAVDLIDEASIPGLQVGAPATVVYEQASPRTARIEGGAREFESRNFNGAILFVALCAAGILAILGAILFAGRATGWLLRRIVQQR